MKQFQTRAIVLKRLDYQEADRIITLLTEDHGKFSAMARAVRRPKSKLAGGIELLTVNEVTIIEGRGEIKTLRSSRMQTHFANITKQYQRLQTAYQFIQAMDRVTEEAVEADYFSLLAKVLEFLNDTDVDQELVELWFRLQLLSLQGRQPDLRVDGSGHKLEVSADYHYDWTEGHLQRHGPLKADHVKLARLAMELDPRRLATIQQSSALARVWLGQMPNLAYH